MKRIYLVKKDEHLPTAQDNWIEMDALQFAAFLETDAGQRRRNRFLQLNNTLGDDEAIFYECSEKEYPIWKKERESELYKNRRQRQYGYTIVTFTTITEDGEEIAGENILPDPGVDIEGDFIAHSEIERLMQAIAQLTDDEQKLIHQFFLSPKPVSELEYGKVNGISQQAANKRKKAVLKKLKKILCE